MFAATVDSPGLQVLAGIVVMVTSASRFRRVRAGRWVIRLGPWHRAFDLSGYAFFFALGLLLFGYGLIRLF